MNKNKHKDLGYYGDKNKIGICIKHIKWKYAKKYIKVVLKYSTYVNVLSYPPSLPTGEAVVSHNAVLHLLLI